MTPIALALVAGERGVNTLPCQHCGHLPTYKHREAQWEPYRSQWQALVAKVAAHSPDVALYQRDLNRWLVEVQDAEPAQAYGLATTRYGREEMRGG